MYFIGIDLAWTYKNESGLCVIDDSGKIVRSESDIFSDEAIAEIVENYSVTGALVGIDAPLIVKNLTGSRFAERALLSGKIHGRHLSVFICNRDFMNHTYGGIRGERVVSRIKQAVPEFLLTPEVGKKPHCLFETFPTGICLGLFPGAYPLKYKVKGKIPFETSQAEMVRLIGTLKTLEVSDPPVTNLTEHFKMEQVSSLSKKEFKSVEDRVDAFLCAYAAYWLAGKPGKVFGDECDGFIVLPVADFHFK
jgi:Uncharacterized protein conserved in bacteria